MIMRAQKIGLIAASVVTGLFLAAVGLVVAWPLFEAREQGLEPAPRGGMMFLQADPQPPREQPIAKEELPNVRGKVVAAKDYALSKPPTLGNLTIFLVHGKDTMKSAKIVTLQE